MFHQLIDFLTKSSSISYFKYSSLFLYIVGFTFLFRVIETWSILSYFSVDSPSQTLFEEFFGLLSDLGAIALCFGLIYFFERLFKLQQKNLELIYLFIYTLFFLAHAILLKYYISQLTPLGEILFQNSWDEIMFTIRSSGFKLIHVVFAFIGALSFFFGSYIIFRNKGKLRIQNTLLSKGTGFIVVALFFVSLFYVSKENYFTNKSVYFASETIDFLTKKDPLDNLHYSKDEVLQFQKAFPKEYVNSEFPFLHKPDTVNYLADYFNKFDSPPNIVLLIIEGLNDDFIHENDGVVLMPFLNQLKDKSLYWKRCFTLGERSFAAVPSTLGGLPYGKISFAQLENYPTFLSLVSVLKRNDYQVSENEGQGAWFLSKGKFFEEQEADYIFDMSSYSKESKKIMVKDYFWGYNDKTLFTEAFKNKDKHPKTPYLDSYFTGTMHSPFKIEDKSHYERRYAELLKKSTNKESYNVLKTNEQYYITTLFTDDALKDFFTAYSKRPEYNNTVFLITGDHPMTEAPRANALKRFHVPLIMYSPKLKKSAVSNNVVCHLDIYQTILNLSRESGVKSPELSSSLGDVLKVEGNNKNRTVVFMDGDRRIQDIYHNGYYLSDKTVYKVHDNWTITEIQNIAVKEDLQKKIDLFNYANLLSTYHNSLFPIDEYLKFFNKEKVLHEIKSTNLKSKELFIPLASTDINKMGNYEVKTTIDYKHFSDDVSIVVQVTSKDGKSLFWENYLLPPLSNKITFQANISYLDNNSGANMSVYIWNKKETEVMVKYSELLITRKK